MRSTAFHTIPLITTAALCVCVFAAVESGGQVMTFSLSSPDIKDGGVIPKKFSCEGKNISPELVWSDPPEGTKSFALMVEDPDAPAGTFVHWIVFDVPKEARRLQRAFGTDDKARNCIKQGTTGFGSRGWGGPCPPKGHGRHRYRFILRALDVKTLGISDGAGTNEVERAMHGHVIAQTHLTGLYQR